MIFIFYLLSIGFGIVIDLLIGDPANKYHPVAWIGNIINFSIPRLKSKNHNPRIERIKGIVFFIIVVASIGIIVYVILDLILQYFGLIIWFITAIIFFKFTISIKGMEWHARRILESLNLKNLIEARERLSFIVRRETNNLDENHILSATIECIAESTVDGITGATFYHSFFGPVGSVIYRVINTLDSMIGYKDEYFNNIGWMSARSDTIFNFIPTRITALLMFLSLIILNKDWKTAIDTYKRYRKKTESPNAGHTLSIMAGGLRIQLEKKGHYIIGEKIDEMTIEKCEASIKIMKLTVILFYMLFSIPTIVILNYFNWWEIIIGF